MNTKIKIVVIAALFLLIAGGLAFTQSTGGSGQKPPFNLDEQYPGPYGGCCGGCCGGYGRW
jgi:hypothetical protein